METKEIVLPDGKKVTICEMNYGFRSDLQGAVSSIEMKGKDKAGKMQKEMNVNVGNLQVMTLVYGIYESEDLGIVKPANEDLGLDSKELEARTIAVRRIMKGADKIYHEINELNREAEEEVLKKSATPLTER